MQTISQLNELRALVRQAKHDHKTIGFVPTMGNLHAGHISLITQAKQRSDFVIASIFVNPLQFGAGEDLDSYPRTLQEDQQKLVEAGCDALFTPNVALMYPQGMENLTTVSVPNITRRLCGASRPGHFDGVTTVVSKLFLMVQPDMGFFGEKDFQQLATIRQMVRDLNFPIDIIGVPIARDEDNLALSSRNGYLSSNEREKAPQLNAELEAAKQQLLDGKKDFSSIEDAAKKHLQNNGFSPDYFEICNPATLEPADANDEALVILAAASLGNTRLIDNVTLNLKSAKK